MGGPLPSYVADLEAYHAEHADLDIDPQHPASTSLRRVNNARRRSALPADLQQRLANIGYGLEARSAEWDHVYAVVLEFYDEHGHCDVPPDLQMARPDGGPGPPVRVWLSNQRHQWQVGVTTREQKAKLDVVGYIWDVEEAE